MKHFASYALLLLLTLISATGFTQSSSKPKQFANYPEIIQCNEAVLSSVFNSTTNQNISLAFSNGFTFSGVVTSNLVKYANLQTAVVRSAAFDNSILSISKRVNEDQSITYVGRIINLNYFDGYELNRTGDGNYQLKKIETAQFIQDCGHQ